MPILGLKSPGPSNPAHFSLEPLIRPNILALQPYRCARDDYSAGVLLDANENAIGPSLPSLAKNTDPGPIAAQTLSLLSDEEVASLNRYPSPTHDDLKRSIAKFRGVPNEEWVFLGVGSDEVIDMLYRVLCVPGKDRVMTCPPTYGMYKVTANVNDVGVLEVPLITEDGAFQLDEKAMNDAFKANPDLKMLFICSPGNPTGTLIPLDVIKRVLENPLFKGVVVVDEAYIDFAPENNSAASLVNEYANVCVTQTLSKSFGLAAIRKALVNALSEIKGVGRILGGNHANFVLCEILDEDGKPSNKKAVEVYKTMAESRGVVVRFRGSERGCEGCLRVTVGTEEECRKAAQQIAALLE
ncbi:hypothetical protein V866_008313 [Kwoniella sp. B9012]|uniref:histidinol-phosphate transaminase n=1 Tax=Kwoniella europaea PYCC6329 TaxID=1423913 RepID=A0AAX4KUR6_9TREE